MDTSNSPSPARIMIVDDHPNTAAMLARVLGKFENPVEVLTACSAEEALELIGDSEIDVLITDFMMSGLTGLDLIERLKDEQKPAHTILITAYDTPALKLSAQHLKVDDYLVKPVQPEKIREIVGRVLKEIRPVREAQPSPGNIPSTLQRPFRILIADDNPDNQRLLSVRLQSEGYEFLLASDGIETLNKIREELPDLVLLDINMPHKDGFEVLLDMRNDTKISHIPVIVVTAARISAKDVREGLTLGADDYVTKPVDWRELSARIRTKLRVKQAEDALRVRNRELSALPELSRDLGERLDVEELTRTVLARSLSALGATNGHLLIFHPDGSVTHQLYKLFDFSPWKWDELKLQFQSAGIISSTLSNRNGQIIKNVATHDGWVKIPNDNAGSAIISPLLGKREVLGVMVLTHEQEGYFKEEHMQLLQAIASQAAIAIENAQLYAIERKRVNELVALNQLTHQISQFAHSSDLFENLAPLVKQHLNYPAVSVWLVDENKKVALCKLAGEENAPRYSLMEIAPEKAASTRRSASFSGAVDERTGERFGVGRPPTVSSLAVPLFWDNQVRGVLAVHSQRTSTFQESDRVLLETLSAHVGIVLERIELFESVEQEKNRTATVLNTAADAILVLDALGQLQLINPAGKRLFTDVKIVTGKSLPVNKGYDALIDLINRASESGKLEQLDISWPGGQTFSAVVSSIEEGGHVAVLHDVSHFMTINQLKNEFIATASHDLKNPIFAVLGYSDLLERVGPLTEMQQDFLKRIRNSARLMQDLVINMLDMARIEMETNWKREPVNLSELIEAAVEEFKTQAEAKNQTIQVHSAKGATLTISGDSMRLQQVLRNLVGNAIKYTPADGRVDIETEVQNGMAIVNVRDTGFGIPEDAIPHIFEKFYRVHTDATQDIEGNGLGLAIVKSIIEQHGGEITVESIEGKGSCFSFRIKQQ